MESYKLKSEEASIVFVGSFNPAIFHPEWLLRHQLITHDDVKGAKVEIIHVDISKFTLEWLAVDVFRHKFTIRTNDPSRFAPLKDLMISVFKILDHTPIKQLGINLTSTYEIDTEENWHKIGDTLVPKAIWEKSLPKRVGMTLLTVRSERSDSLEGDINVRISPIKEGFYGVDFSVNNHIKLQSDQEKEETIDVPTILSNNWDIAIEMARNIGNTTLSNIIGT